MSLFEYFGRRTKRLDVIEWKLDRIANVISRIEAKVNRIMPTLDDIQAKAKTTLDAINADTAIDTSVATLVTNMNQTIMDLKNQLGAAGTDPAKLQALSDTLDAILASDTANSKIVSDAVVSGTPAATPTDPATPTT